VQHYGHIIGIYIGGVRREGRNAEAGKEGTRRRKKREERKCKKAKVE